MSIDETPRRERVDGLPDEALDAIMDEWDDEWDDDWDDEWFPEDIDEPPGDLQPAAGTAELGASIREGLAEVIARGTEVWGCDGTLRLTRAWGAAWRACPDRIEANFRRTGVHCDCAVLSTVLGSDDTRPRCARRR